MDGEGRSTEGFGIDRAESVNLIVRTALQNDVSDPKQIAYMLATVQHETRDFQAPEEDYGRSQARKLGYGGGEEYYGRGYVHLTHDYNYRKFDGLLGMGGDLLKNPGKAKDPELAARILVIGMRDGLFTGKRLDRYVNADVQDFYNARRTVNGITRHEWTVRAAEDCERYANEWEKLTPALIKHAEEQIALESFDPMRDIAQAITRITGVETHDARITNGMPDYLRKPAARPDAAMQDGVLRQGESGVAVRDLQERLNRLGTTDGQGSVLLADGDFGRKTRDAVENFQLWHGLPTTGVADRDTLAAMRNPAFVSRPARPGDAADLNTHEGSLRPATSGTPADANHPDHAMLERIRMGVRAISEKESGDDDRIERVSRSLLAACKDNREMHSGTSVSLSANALRRVDHVVMGTTGNIFAVEGRLDDPAHKRVCVPYAQAAQTPVEQSDQKLSVANQSIYQEQQLTEQQGRTRELGNPSRGGPAMAC